KELQGTLRTRISAGLSVSGRGGTRRQPIPASFMFELSSAFLHVASAPADRERKHVSAAGFKKRPWMYDSPRQHAARPFNVCSRVLYWVCREAPYHGDKCGVK